MKVHNRKIEVTSFVEGLFSTGRHCQFLGVDQSQKQAQLYLCYSLFRVQQDTPYMRSRQSPDLELFRERTSYIQRNVKSKDLVRFFWFFFRSPACSVCFMPLKEHVVKVGKDLLHVFQYKSNHFPEYTNGLSYMGIYCHVLLVDCTSGH